MSTEWTRLEAMPSGDKSGFWFQVPALRFRTSTLSHLAAQQKPVSPSPGLPQKGERKHSKVLLPRACGLSSTQLSCLPCPTLPPQPAPAFPTPCLSASLPPFPSLSLPSCLPAFQAPSLPLLSIQKALRKPRDAFRNISATLPPNPFETCRRPPCLPASRPCPLAQLRAGG